MDPEDIANCQFVPIRALEKAKEFVETLKTVGYDTCKRNVYSLQQTATIYTVNKSSNFLRNYFDLAIYRAIYTHDWNKLLYLLKKSPIWKQTTGKLNGTMLYVRAMTILLMYHPSAQAQKLLDEYIHMVCTCRSEEEKKALKKLILTLPEKFVERYLYLYQRKHNKYRSDNY